MKPKILSVKLGYNPNSSSIGMLVKIFLWSTFFVSIFFGLIGSIITVKSKKRTSQTGSGTNKELQ